MADTEFRYLVASDASGPLGFAILHETMASAEQPLSQAYRRP